MSQAGGVPPSAVDPLQRDWPTERLNTAYTIQFPTTYQGTGAVGFEGLTFNKARADGQVQMSYSFCGSTFCSEYGQSLRRPVPASITVPSTTLDQAISLKQDNQLVGVFYYANQSKTVGQLYLVNDGQLKESLNVQYDYSQQAEVVAILQTIRLK